MKKLFFILLAIAALCSSGIVITSITQAAEDIKGAHVVAYYFHGTMRCPTCHKLEQYSKEAIESNFKDASRRDFYESLVPSDYENRILCA